MMSAMTFNYGGAPVGPAGTGKTETIKVMTKFIYKLKNSELFINLNNIFLFCLNAKAIS